MTEYAITVGVQSVLWMLAFVVPLLIGSMVKCARDDNESFDNSVLSGIGAFLGFVWYVIMCVAALKGFGAI